MNNVDLKEHTKAFALRVICLVQTLPRTSEGYIIDKQLLRSTTSVGAHYRAVCCARSRADLAAKLGIALEEADESAFWLELLCDAHIVPTTHLDPLIAEAREIAAIIAASRKTVTKKQE